MYQNANIPLIECYVRGNYLRNQKDSHDQYFKCVVFGVSSIPKQTPLFHFVMEDGGIWWRAPISAFTKKPNVKELPLNELVLWDSFSYNISITTFHFLANCKMSYTSRRKIKYMGRYLFTIDWSIGDYNELNFGYAEAPDQHKCGHVIELEDGNYAIQPNNRLRVYDSNMGIDTNKTLIHRLVNTHNWSVEDTAKWITTEKEEGSYDYDIEENNNKEGV